MCYLLVIVDVKLSIRVRLACGLEGDLNETCAENIVEYGLPEGSVLVENLVTNILRKDV